MSDKSLRFEQPARSIREGRSEHIQPSNIGRMTLYTFKDVLDYAYTQGFSHFGEPSVLIKETYSSKGNLQSTAIVTIPAVFIDIRNDMKGGYEAVEVECWGTGDANFENTGNANIGQHFIRMAETRAKGRALAHALNLDANFSEEMGGDAEPAPAPARKAAPTGSSRWPKENPNDFPPHNIDGGWACEETGEVLKDTEASSAGQKALWSVRKNNGRILSWDAQQALKNG